MRLIHFFNNPLSRGQQVRCHFYMHYSYDVYAKLYAKIMNLFVVMRYYFSRLLSLFQRHLEYFAKQPGPLLPEMGVSIHPLP